MQNIVKRHPWFWAIISVSALCLLALVTAVAPALAEDRVPVATGPLYQVDMQLWQDRDLLTNPKLTLPQNELAEITVDDPMIVPDKVKVIMRVLDASTSSKSAQNGTGAQILVESEIFLPQGGQWTKAASPMLVIEKGARSMMEISVSGAGFTHANGQPVEKLTLFVLVKDSA